MSLVFLENDSSYVPPEFVNSFIDIIIDGFYSVIDRNTIARIEYDGHNLGTPIFWKDHIPENRQFIKSADDIQKSADAFCKMSYAIIGKNPNKIKVKVERSKLKQADYIKIWIRK